MPLTLDQIRRTTEAGELPADAVATALADVTRYVLGAGAITLDQAFGVRVPSGCDPWFTRLARDRRDKAIRALGEMLTGTTSEKANMVSRKIRKYRPTWQRRDQHLAAAPTDDPCDRLLFAAFRACDGSIPDSPDHLRKLLAA